MQCWLTITLWPHLQPQMELCCSYAPCCIFWSVSFSCRQFVLLPILSSSIHSILANVTLLTARLPLSCLCCSLSVSPGCCYACIPEFLPKLFVPFSFSLHASPISLDLTWPPHPHDRPCSEHVQRGHDIDMSTIMTAMCSTCMPICIQPRQMDRWTHSQMYFCQMIK